MEYHSEILYFKYETHTFGCCYEYELKLTENENHLPEDGFRMREL